MRNLHIDDIEIIDMIISTCIEKKFANYKNLPEISDAEHNAPSTMHYRLDLTMF